MIILFIFIKIIFEFIKLLKKIAIALTKIIMVIDNKIFFKVLFLSNLTLFNKTLTLVVLIVFVSILSMLSESNKLLS